MGKAYQGAKQDGEGASALRGGFGRPAEDETQMPDAWERTLLVVDDDPTIGELITLHAKENGFSKIDKAYDARRRHCTAGKRTNIR